MSTPATSSSAPSVIHKCDYWMRVGLQLELCIKDALLDVMHNESKDPSYSGLPEDPALLYNRMVIFKTTYQKQLKNVLKADQWNVLCPKNGLSDSKNWDITLIIIAIMYETNLPPPAGGWNQKNPNGLDQSKAAYCLRAKQMRNTVNHGCINDILTQAQYTMNSTKIERILNGLHYRNMALFKDLETGSLKMYTRKTVKVLEVKVSSLAKSINDLEITKVDANTANMNAVQSIAVGNTATIKQLNVEVKSITLQLRSMQEEGLVDLNQSVADLTEDLNDLQSDFALVENKVTNNKFDIVKIQSDFQALYDMISDVEIQSNDTKLATLDAIQVVSTKADESYERFSNDLEAIKSTLRKTEHNLEWKLDVNTFCQRLFAILNHLDENEFAELKYLCFQGNLIESCSLEELGKKDLCEMIDRNGSDRMSNAKQVSALLTNMEKQEEINYLKGFLPEDRNVFVTLAVYIFNQIFIVLTTLRKLPLLFLFAMVVWIYSEDIRDYYRYRWCIYGCITASQFSFNFRAYRDPTQLNFVEGNVEFEWEKFQHYFPLIKPHPHKQMHYFLNTDRCILGDVRDVGNSFLKKRPVRGAEIFAVPRDCTQVWFHDDNERYWKMYRSASNITCTKLVK